MNEKYVILVNHEKYYVCKIVSPYDEQKLICNKNIEDARKFSTKKDAKYYCFILKKYTKEKAHLEVKKIR